MMLTENHNLVDGDGPLFTYGHGSALVSPPRNLITPGSFIQTNRSTVEEEDHVDAHRRSYFPGSPQASTDPMSSTTTHTSNTQKCSLTSTEMVAHTPTQHLHAHPHKHPPTASALVCWLRRQTPWYMDELRHRALLKPIPMPPSIVDFIHRNLFINNIITDNNNNRMVYVWPEEMLTTPTSASPQIEVPFYRMMVASADERKTQQLNDSRQLRRQRKSSHAPIVVKVCREELALCTLAITRRAYAEKLVEQRVLFYQKARDVDEAMVSDEDVAQLGEPLVRCTTSSQESPPTLAPCASTQPSMFHTYRPICYEELAISPRLLSRQRRAEMRAMLHQRSSSEDLYGCPVRYERCTSTTA